MKPASAKLTYDDFLRFPDDGQRHELIDGEHYVTPSPVIPHQRLVGRLHGELYDYFKSNTIGEVFTAPLDVILSNHDVVEPDVLVVLKDQAELLTAKHIHGAPAIVIEVLSPGTRRRDEGIKRQLYDRVGVREYWLVDPDDQTVTVCRRGADGSLHPDARLSPNSAEVLASDLLPGFSLALTELFR